MKRHKRLAYWGLAASMAGFVLGRPALATITATAERGYLADSLDGQISSSDLLQGLIATEREGDTGWYPANPAAGNSLLPDGLPAFTDGAGDLSGVTGLLNDFYSRIR